VILCAIRQKRQMLISLLKNPHDIRFENMYVYSKSLQQLKYWYLKNLLTLVTLHFPIIATSFYKARHFQILFSFLMMLHMIKRHGSVSAPSYALRPQCLFYAKRRIDRSFDYRISITTELIKF